MNIESQHPKNCQGCSLHQGRTQVVHSILPKGAEILFVAEAPGKNEDEQGVPLVGKAGMVFNRVLESAGLDRAKVAIANTVSCRPPNNRKPMDKEILACLPYLEKEIRLLRPKVIVLLGSTSTSALLPHADNISKIRGKWFFDENFGCHVVPTFHPAAVIYDSKKEDFMRHDVSEVVYRISHEMDTEGKSNTSYHVVSSKQQFDWLIGQLHKQETWAFDTETTGFNFLEDEVFIITFSWKERTAVLVDLRVPFFKENSDYVWKQLKGVFENGSKKIMQNGAFDIKMLFKYGVRVSNYYSDTMHMHYLLGEDRLHDLGAIALEYTDCGGYEQPLEQLVKKMKADAKKQQRLEIVSEEDEEEEEGNGSSANGGVSYADIPTNILYPYALTDADVTFRAYTKMLPQIFAEKLDFTLFNIMMPAQKMLLMTEYEGVSFDELYAKRLQEEYANKIEVLEQKIHSYSEVRAYTAKKQEDLRQAHELRYLDSSFIQKRHKTFEEYLASMPESRKTFEFKPTSSTQLREFLYDFLGLKPTKYTKNKNKKSKEKTPSVDASVLKHFAGKVPFCATISEKRRLSQMKATFIDGALRVLGKDKRLRTQYFLTGTKTGRPSSRNPNLNNIPRTGTSTDIKNMFIADPDGDNWIVELDGKAMEFRVWASMSQDDRMIQDIHLGLDIHKVMGGVGFHHRELPAEGDITQEDFARITEGVSKEERQKAKTEFVFGPMYGRIPETIAEVLDMSISEAKRVQQTMFRRYKSASTFLNKKKIEARTQGYVRCLYGRKRRLPGALQPPRHPEHSGALRQATNSPIQGTASDLTLRAGVRIVQWLWKNHMKTRLILTVYDSVIFCVPREELTTFIPKAVALFQQKEPQVHVNIEAEVKIGKRWGKTEEVSLTKPIEEEINRITQMHTEVN